MNNLSKLLPLVLACRDLGKVPRTGWVCRGVPEAEVEDLAAHSISTALTLVVLRGMLPGMHDPDAFQRALLMAAIHELGLEDPATPTMTPDQEDSDFARGMQLLQLYDLDGLFAEYTEQATDAAKAVKAAGSMATLAMARYYQSLPGSDPRLEEFDAGAQAAWTLTALQGLVSG